MRAIADTGFLVAFGNRRDLHHAWALELSRQIRDPLLTCEAVLSEATFHLGNAQLVLDYINDGLVRVGFALGENLPRIAQLARKFPDRSLDLAGLCLIRMSELNPKLLILTTDPAGFRVYRRNQRDRIPLIHP